MIIAAFPIALAIFASGAVAVDQSVDPTFQVDAVEQTTAARTDTALYTDTYPE